MGFEAYGKGVGGRNFPMGLKKSDQLSTVTFLFYPDRKESLNSDLMYINGNRRSGKEIKWKH
jgi:hypothetical protein